jgi:hypothetical protein
MPGTAAPTEPAQVRAEGEAALQRPSALAAAVRQHEGPQRNVPSKDGEHHDDALRRLDEAVAEQKRRRNRYDAAYDTPGEPAAFVRVCEANERVSTRRRWLCWVDQHYHY